MRVLRERMLRIVRGPAGGMLAMLLLAAALSGVAAATPGNGTDQTAPQAQAAEDHAESDPDDHADITDEHSGDDHQVPAREHTAADCQALVDGVELVKGADATGLDNAIAKVSASCEDNLTAPGLLVALEHLVANQQRQAEHAAAAADHGRSSEHGPFAVHGASAEAHQSAQQPGSAGS